MICINNKRRGETGFYVGRGIPLGNPFVIGRDGTREEVIEKYRGWLKNKVADNDPLVMAQLNTIKKVHKKQGHISLLCWCNPLPCHAEVIAEYIRG